MTPYETAREALTEEREALLRDLSRHTSPQLIDAKDIHDTACGLVVDGLLERVAVSFKQDAPMGFVLTNKARAYLLRLDPSTDIGGSAEVYGTVAGVAGWACVRCGDSYPSNHHHECKVPDAEDWVALDRKLTAEENPRLQMALVHKWLRLLTWQATGRLPDHWAPEVPPVVVAKPVVGEPSEPWMAPGFAVFNGHVNKADERARKMLADTQPEWLEEVEQIETEGNGIMAVLQRTPTPAVAAYVSLVTAFVNENRLPKPVE